MFNILLYTDVLSIIIMFIMKFKTIIIFPMDSIVITITEVKLYSLLWHVPYICQYRSK